MKARDSIINLKYIYIYTSEYLRSLETGKIVSCGTFFQIDIRTDCFKFREYSPKKCFRLEERYIEHIT